MICPICKTRWAGFPTEDFDFVKGDCKPKNDEAVAKRIKKFDSNEQEICSPECDETSSCIAIAMRNDANTPVVVITPEVSGVATKSEYEDFKNRDPRDTR